MVPLVDVVIRVANHEQENHLDRYLSLVEMLLVVAIQPRDDNVSFGEILFRFRDAHDEIQRCSGSIQCNMEHFQHYLLCFHACTRVYGLD